jgi:hypothetical protein
MERVDRMDRADRVGVNHGNMVALVHNHGNMVPSVHKHGNTVALVQKSVNHVTDRRKGHHYRGRFPLVKS